MRVLLDTLSYELFSHSYFIYTLDVSLIKQAALPQGSDSEYLKIDTKGKGVARFELPVQQPPNNTSHTVATNISLPPSPNEASGSSARRSTRRRTHPKARLPRTVSEPDEPAAKPLKTKSVNTDPRSAVSSAEAVIATSNVRSPTMEPDNSDIQPLLPPLLSKVSGHSASSQVE